MCSTIRIKTLQTIPYTVVTFPSINPSMISFCNLYYFVVFQEAFLIKTLMLMELCEQKQGESVEGEQY